MSDTVIDDRAALKARFSGFTNARLMHPPEGEDEQPVLLLTDSLSANEPVMRSGFDEVKLKIRRSQSKGVFGGVAFKVHFVAELSSDARDAVFYYRFGKTVLYQKPLELKLSLYALVMFWRSLWLWLTRSRWQITVNDIVRGRTVTCKNILDVLQTEDDIREAAETFVKILRAASWFGGEEVVAL
ncbi:MAG: hypothetical protein AAGJ70_13320 [Pseudomonadota bacterium]